MNVNKDSVSGLLLSVVDARLKYLVPREGQVKDIIDPVKKGRILVVIPSLGWHTPAEGAWCYGIDKNMISTVKVDDWVIVQFVDGDENFPICIGKSTRIKDQIPTNYDGVSTTHILYESPANTIHIKYDEKANLLQMGNSNFRGSARVDDTTTSTSAEDSTWWTWLNGLINVFTDVWVPVPNDGGSALKIALEAYITTSPIPTKIDGKISSGSEQIQVGDI